MVSFDTPLRSSASWLKAFVLVVCFSILGIEVWRDWEEREQEVTRINSELKNLSKSLSQHVEDTFDLADAILVDLVDRIEKENATPAAMVGMEGFLSMRIQNLQSLKSLTIYGADGLLLSGSLPGHRYKINGHTQAFFRHHFASPDKGVFFGPMIRDPLGSDWIVTLTRRIDKADGSFGGVAVVSIPPRYFANFFSRIELGSKGSIALFHSENGTLLSRYPYVDQAIGTQQSNAPWLKEKALFGPYTYTSPFDGTLRLSAYQKNHAYPFTVLAAVSQSEALSNWLQELRFRVVGTVILVAMIGTLGWRLAGELRRREAVEAELSVLASTDGLTGLANRRTFDRHLDTEWLRASREGTPVSLLMIDVDRFKTYNDHYGHPAGDECLRKLAILLVQAVHRPNDLVARYGGEEIAVLLPNTDKSGAVRVAERIRTQVEALALRHEGNPPSNVLTISIGSVTRSPAQERPRIASSELVSLADKALYEAKLNGRNRVVIAQAA